ncbi:MAG: Crp/Fnr family transcriptional regulator [Rickettsiales bacterium]
MASNPVHNSDDSSNESTLHNAPSSNPELVLLDNSCALFKGLSAADLQKLALHSKRRVVPRNQYLANQSAKIDQVFNVESGVILLERISVDGQRQVLSFIFQGESVGLTDAYGYSIKSLTDVTVYQFQRKKLISLASELQTLEKNINDISKLILSDMVDRFCLLGQKRAHERICFLLIELLKRMPGATVDHIALPMTRVDTADYLGLTVETVSRSVSKLKHDGLIDIDKDHVITILDLDAIQELADIS